MLNEISNIRPTKSQNSNVSRLDLQLPLRNILDQYILDIYGMLEAMLQLHLSDQQFNYLLKCDLY